MRKFVSLFAALVGVAWSTAALAGTITVYTDRSLYDAAMATHSNLTTEAVPLSPFVNPTELNITSSSGANPVNVATITSGTYLSNQHNVATDGMKFAPAVDVRALAFDYFLGNPGTIGTLTGMLSVNGSVLGSTTNVNGSPAMAFFGVIADSPIASVLFARTATGGFQANQVEFINNISYATVAQTPVPATLPLFISALGGLGFLGWRRRTATAA